MRQFIQIAEQVSKYLFHGSDRYLENFSGDVLYLTDNVDEAVSYAFNVHRPNVKSVEHFLYTVSNDVNDSNSMNIENDEFYDELAEGDIEEYISRIAIDARKNGLKYLTYSHPSALNGGDYNVYVALYPKQVNYLCPKGHRLLESFPLWAFRLKLSSAHITLQSWIYVVG